MIGGTPISGNLHRTGGQTINQLLSVDYQHFDPETIHIYICNWISIDDHGEYPKFSNCEHILAAKHMDKKWHETVKDWDRTEFGDPGNRRKPVNLRHKKRVELSPWPWCLVSSTGCRSIDFILDDTILTSWIADNSYEIWWNIIICFLVKNPNVSWEIPSKNPLRTIIFHFLYIHI